MNSIPAIIFADWVGGWSDGFNPGAMISSFCLDSNAIEPYDLFIAIKGERVDGHDFVEQALARGAVGTLAEREVPPPSIQVANVVAALASLADHFRTEFSGPVIAITGSAGKTTTKEFVACALSPLGPILKTQGNRNTEYTVPLLWTDLQPDHKAVVVEMSMRGFGQIKHLTSFSRPTIGLVTNIGYAHMQQVESRQGIANAKGELLEQLPKTGFAVLWHEDEFLEVLRGKTNAKVKTFGTEEGADCRIIDYKPQSWQSAIVTGEVDGKTWEAEMPAVGRHIALNAAASVLVATLLGVEPSEAAAQIKNAVLPPMRMEVIERNGATILLDTYNASPPSMIAAIETLSELPVEGRRFAVIGDMRELGEYTEAAHRALGKALGEAKFTKILFYGQSTILSAEEAIQAGQPPESISQTEEIDDATRFLSQLEPGDAVLIKGSRSLELEGALETQVGH